MEKIVDVCGKACPIPVVEATHALAALQGAGSIKVYVDNDTAVQNLQRLAKQKQAACSVSKAPEGHSIVTLTLDGAPAAAAAGDTIVCQPCGGGDYVIAVDTDTMGRGSEELGGTLMKGFLFAVTQLENLPSKILFYNGGAKLTVEGSASLDDLKHLVEQGVEILTCGTCLNYYGLTDQLAVGSVTNMYSIVEALTEAGKVIKP